MVVDKQILLTIDVDYTDYFTGKGVDELDLVFKHFKKFFQSQPNIKSTWFIRIDDQIKALFGKPDYIFTKHCDKIEWLLNEGHEIGWHHHAYIKKNEAWMQDINVSNNLSAIERNGEIAFKRGISSSRMGWGYQTNETINLLDSMGFKIDSSAIPRPSYKWEKYYKNWVTTGQVPYHPSIDDYRVTATKNLKILEVPISTVILSSPLDTDKNVMRYINPAYKSEYFKTAVTQSDNSSLVLILHPYELLKRDDSLSELIAFDFNVFEKNMDFLMIQNYSFKRMDSLILKS